MFQKVSDHQHQVESLSRAFALMRMLGEISDVHVPFT